MRHAPYSQWNYNLSHAIRFTKLPVVRSHDCNYVFNFLLEDNCFTIWCWLLPCINMNQSPLSHFPPIPPLRLSQSPGLSSPGHTANPCWRSLLHVTTCMFPCYSLSSSCPLPPTLFSQVWSPSLHLHCCPASRFISTIFLESIFRIIRWKLQRGNGLQT